MTTDRRVIDLSHPLEASTPPFPGDPAVEITVFDSTERDDGQFHVNASRIATSLHCGTHMDAPFHFFGDGKTMEHVALESCFGPATLVRLEGELDDGVIHPRHLEPNEESLVETRRVILDTGWHRRWKSDNYFTEHPVLTGETARYLVERGVLLIGVDFPSVDREPFPAHLELLGSGVLIVENLTRLDEIAAPRFDFHAAPLKIVGRDGSPVRAFAIVNG
jgi:kynurenine formamidase